MIIKLITGELVLGVTERYGALSGHDDKAASFIFGTPTGTIILRTDPMCKALFLRHRALLEAPHNMEGLGFRPNPSAQLRVLGGCSSYL